jgi:hypothetical protein
MDFWNRHWAKHIRRASFRSAVAKLWQDFEDLVKYLAKHGVDPVLVGGMAVQHHGLTRLTEDIDILISRTDYDRLVTDGLIKFGSLKHFKSGVQVDVLTEGKDGNPDPSVVRNPESPNLPTLEGLIYLKLLAGRLKDHGDIGELLKIHEFDPDIRSRLTQLTDDPNLLADYDSIVVRAKRE